MLKYLKSRLAETGILGSVQKCGVLGGNSPVCIAKNIDNIDFSRLGAVSEPSESSVLEFNIRLPRSAGAVGAKLVFSRDFGETSVFELALSTDFVTDSFSCALPVSLLPDKLSCGLYYYHFELSFGDFTLYTVSVNNADFELWEEYCDPRFRLLVYEKDFETPEWFKGNIMYHVFVDRFNKGSVKTPLSETAVINPDWDNGIPQYGEYPGAFVENNVFFGGTLYGVAEKLDYLSDFGVGCIYLSPIFKAYSNHKYDTGDYMTVDEMFGGETALKQLLAEAEKRNIKIIIDGVFNHTGDDSLYFNRYGRYDSTGAYGNENSPYRNWYSFEKDGKYKSWWGIDILPKLNLYNENCKNFFLGEKGVLEKYLDMGISGVRLDVADELPESFLEQLRTLVKKKKHDGLIIGEVWENAADKIAYGERRKYFRGRELDSVMNYPMKNAVIEFVKNGNAEFFYNTITELYASYPKACSDVLMNILGTHDTDRIITVLSGDSPEPYTNAQLSVKRMTESQRQEGKALLKCCAALQYTLFGTPSVFYGDETGLEGYRDPFCRMPFPWKSCDTELAEYYKALGKMRRNEPLFKDGDFAFTKVSDGFVAYKRYNAAEEILVLANMTKKEAEEKICGIYNNLLTEEIYKNTCKIPARCVIILKKIY